MAGPSIDCNLLMACLSCFLTKHRETKSKRGLGKAFYRVRFRWGKTVWSSFTRFFCCCKKFVSSSDGISLCDIPYSFETFHAKEVLHEPTAQRVFLKCDRFLKCIVIRARRRPHKGFKCQPSLPRLLPPVSTCTKKCGAVFLFIGRIYFNMLTLSFAITLWRPVARL